MSMQVAAGGIKLPPGKTYHVKFLYNNHQAGHPKTSDMKLSLSFVKVLTEEVKRWGFSDVYYHDNDALPGRPVFNELFRATDESVFIFVILTEEFIKSSWNEYRQNSVLKSKLEENYTKQVIPILIGNAELPREFESITAVTFDGDPTKLLESKRELDNLKEALLQAIHELPDNDDQDQGNQGGTENGPGTQPDSSGPQKSALLRAIHELPDNDDQDQGNQVEGRENGPGTQPDSSSPQNLVPTDFIVLHIDSVPHMYTQPSTPQHSNVQNMTNFKIISNLIFYTQRENSVFESGQMVKLSKDFAFTDH